MPINLKLLNIFCVSYVTFISVNSDISCMYLLITVPEDGLICQNMLKAEYDCCNSTNSVYFVGLW